MGDDFIPNVQIITFVQNNVHIIIFVARWYRKRKVKVFDCFYT